MVISLSPQNIFSNCVLGYDGYLRILVSWNPPPCGSPFESPFHPPPPFQASLKSFLEYSLAVLEVNSDNYP
eukprot:764396-Hanusia_phi.AAC.3